MNASDYLTLSVFFAIFGLAGFALGRLTRNRAHYYRGYVNGRREERSRTNAIVIPAKLKSYKQGREDERKARSMDALLRKWDATRGIVTVSNN